MKLADLRKISVKQNLRIRFGLTNGMECVVNERGVAQVPALHAPPDFNLEDELARAAKFVLEPVATGSKASVKPRSCTRQEMAAMAAAGPGETAHDDHDE